MSAKRGPYLRLVWTDAESGRQGFVVIDRLVRGLSGGGTRVRAGCTLEEVTRLAATMSLKNGVLGIPAGGAKCGLDCDPTHPDAVPLLTRFVRAMVPLWDTYVATGEDLGVQQSTLNEIFGDLGLGSTMRAALKSGGDFDRALREMGLALSRAHEGTPLVDLVGGYGVAAATVAALGRLGLDVRDTRVVIQGFGSMGGATARYLARRGAAVIGVADVRGLVVNQAGLDIERLLGARDPFGVIDRGALRRTDRELPGDDWLALECDVLVPAALADVINSDNCDRVRTELIVEAANLPTTSEAAARLEVRGVAVIPDFVANSATNGWAWWLALGEIGPTAEAAFGRIGEVIPRVVCDVLDIARAERIAPREAAERIAKERLDRLTAEFGAEGPLTLPIL